MRNGEEELSFIIETNNIIKMGKSVSQCAGVDCAKKDFWVTFSVMDDQRNIDHLGTQRFLMNDAGFKAFVKWIGKRAEKSLDFLMVLEATGVYHEKLLHLVYDLGYKVSLVHPKRAKDFSKTVLVKKVTDKIASKYLATMGLEKKLPLWQKPEKVYRNLRVLTRESSQLQEKITMIKNELEAEDYRQDENAKTAGRLKTELKLLVKQKKEVLIEITALINSDPILKIKTPYVTSPIGVGILTAATVIAETQGFAQVRNKRQLVSYVGYDVINQESGTSVRTQARISKRGNRRIRKAMHMAALSSIRHGAGKDMFVRIVSRTGIKMKGVVAVQRKLLVLMYTLWKKEQYYDPKFDAKKEGDIVSPEELDIVRS
jgi:transposase